MNLTCPRCGSQMHKGGRTPGGAQRWQCRSGGGDRRICYSTTEPNGSERKQDGTTVRRGKIPVFKRALGKANVFVVTAAQNATPVHKGFLKALETYCNSRNAELIAVPLRYKNPTSRWTASQANEEVWDDALTPYLCNERKRLNKNLVVLGDVKTQPTAVNPLTGYEALTHGESSLSLIHI